MNFTIKNSPDSKYPLKYFTADLWSPNNDDDRILFFEFSKDHTG